MRSSTCSLLSAAALVAGLASPIDAIAASSSRISVDPVCVTGADAVLFFIEQTDNCDGADKQCRNSRWAYGALAAKGGWSFERLGDASLDEEAAPEKNAHVARQLFKAPAAHPCASFFRAPRLPSPDLPYAEAWFEYSIEGGALVLHWQGQREIVVPGVQLWRLGWCGAGCKAGQEPRAEALALGAGNAKALATQMPPTVPAIDLALGEQVILGFAEPKKDGATELGYLIVRVPQSNLRGLQAKLLHKDAKRLLEKAAGDLFASAQAAGVFDAALQLDPANAEARFDYARLLALRGEPAPVVRELERLRGTPRLRARLEAERGFATVRGTEPFKKFLQSLPK
ncbi:MAG: hypothetical protein ACOX6T_14915 [Myxococcales bacterium]|jgi:hypothetical protein